VPGPAASCAGSSYGRPRGSLPSAATQGRGPCPFQDKSLVCGRPTRRDHPPLSVRKDRPTTVRRSGASPVVLTRAAPRGHHATLPGASAPRTPSERTLEVPVFRGRRPCVRDARTRWVRCTSRRRFMRTRVGTCCQAPLAVPRPDSFSGLPCRRRGAVEAAPEGMCFLAARGASALRRGLPSAVLFTSFPVRRPTCRAGANTAVFPCGGGQR
jgi:hypothetical protein